MTAKKPAAKKPAAKKPAAKKPAAKKPAAKKRAAKKSDMVVTEQTGVEIIQKNFSDESKSVISWEDEMAKDAQIAAEKEASSAGGQFFCTAGGILKFDDCEIPGNKMLVVVLHSIFENVFYEGRYDPDNPNTPICFAFGEYEQDLTPHKVVVEAGQSQTNDDCSNCEHNEWGSAEMGKGKACRNSRRLGLITAGEYDKNGGAKLFNNADHFEKTVMGFLRVPPTSIKNYASFVKQVANGLGRPPYGIVTQISVVPDAKTQFKFVFEPVDKIPNDLGNVIMKRREECRALIDQPYQLDQEESEVVSRATKKSSKAKRKY